MSTRQIFRLIPFLSILILTLLTGCSDTTDPVLDEDDDSGRIDPGSGSFFLKSVDVTMAGGHIVRLDLVGSDLELDDDGIHINLTVAVRNAANIVLPGPVTLWLGPIDPASVFVANPDTSLPVGSIIPVDGFIYETEFGNDRLLEPGETSEGKLWRFRTPDQGSFSFGIGAETHGDPSGPVIAGACFWDPNRNGVRDPGETPLAPGHVHITAPDSTRIEIPVDRDGGYVFLLQAAGLHRLEYIPLFDTFAPLAFSTPNPRHVLITPYPDGSLRGFPEANFGAYTDIPMGPPPIRFTETPLDSLHHAPWDLIGTEMVNSWNLVCDVGYSGCEPDHRFSLWTDGSFMESMPVQVNIVLVHETEELCPAAWRQGYPFDLSPLRNRFLDAYGPGVLLLNLIDFNGDRHQIEWGIFPPD
jgi:hypothetical protein